MSNSGVIKSLYTDSSKTNVLLPRTKTKAVSNDDGIGLDALLGSVPYYGVADSTEVSAAPLNADTLGGFSASDFAPAADYATKADLTRITPEDIGAAPAKNYATESFVTNKIAEAQFSGSGDGGSVDLSGLQSTITGAATTITDVNLPKNMALVSSSEGKVATSSVTSAELAHLVGTTSNIQDQLDARYIGKGVVKSSDFSSFNLIEDFGCYWVQVSGMTNSPFPDTETTGKFGHLEVLDNSASILQRFTQYSPDEGIVAVYERDKTVNWSEWRRTDGYGLRGYGLGEYVWKSGGALADADSATLSGLYFIDGNTANGIGASATLEVLGYSSSYVIQTAYAASSKTVKRRQRTGSGWSSWELLVDAIGARPNTWMPTAADVGARPNTWMPTAADVGAAPSGFGLGISDCININSGFKNITKNGWWISTTDTPDGSWWRCLSTVTNGGNNIVLDAWSLDGKFRASLTKNGTWGEWEWFNPPLGLGIEYRTTERFQSRPVYCKLVGFGSGPNNTSKSIEHGIENIYIVTEWHCHNINTGTNISQATHITAITVDRTNINVTTSANESAWNMRFLIKYTKTTD